MAERKFKPKRLYRIVGERADGSTVTRTFQGIAPARKYADTLWVESAYYDEEHVHKACVSVTMEISEPVRFGPSVDMPPPAKPPEGPGSPESPW
jgi:hypothetical protein